MKPFVFTLMPFSENFDDIYKVGIKDTAQKLGAYCERVDEQIFQGSILERILNQISKADVIVADMTGRNANVFFEVGFATALKKKLILLTQDVKDIPFDLMHHTHIEYKGKIIKLQEALERFLVFFLSEQDKTDAELSFGLELNIDGIRLEEGNEVIIKKDMLTRNIKLSIQNISNKVCESGSIQIGINSKKDTFTDYFPYLETKYSDLSQEESVIIHTVDENIFPYGWFSINLIKPFSNIDYNGILRIYTMYGYHDFPFRTETDNTKIKIDL